jgi:hypothetical protein
MSKVSKDISKKNFQSRATNLTYANWFCALCNGDFEELVPQRGDVFCNNVDIIDGCAFDVTKDILDDDNYHPGQLRCLSYQKFSH